MAKSGKTLMVVGSCSSAGKSLLVTALCRVFARQGIRVAPFKGQNLSNNAAVCADGSEIGRAQALQAEAAGIAPTADMNPLLLKPGADGSSQVVLMGKVLGDGSTSLYEEHGAQLWTSVTAAFDRLRSSFDLVIIEGAGSVAELNMTGHDMVNMAIARYAHAPVLLVGDIERGGVFAQLLGTLYLLSPEERACVKGLVVNKFHGDLELFDDGVRILEERSGLPVLGVIPFVADLDLPEEDAACFDMPVTDTGHEQDIDIVVIRLPHIANFDDFDPLATEDGVHIRYVASPHALGSPAAVILPGTRSTMGDLEWLRSAGLADAIRDLATHGTPVVGICGGYQMLGLDLQDPGHVESSMTEATGLGLLSHRTTFLDKKTTRQVQGHLTSSIGWLSSATGLSIHGYEIHMGTTCGNTPWMSLTRRGEEGTTVADGNMSPDSRVWGCYVHGLFANDSVRHAWLTSLGWHNTAGNRMQGSRAKSLDRLADAVLCAVDMQLLQHIIDEQ
ncbi:MAG: cobyric acid synthase [Candidatus Cryosericum sp.]